MHTLFTTVKSVPQSQQMQAKKKEKEKKSRKREDENVDAVCKRSLNQKAQFMVVKD